jgi:hypothetical protein
MFAQFSWQGDGILSWMGLGIAGVYYEMREKENYINGKPTYWKN